MTKKARMKLGLWVIASVAILTVIVISLSSTFCKSTLSANISTDLPKVSLFCNNNGSSTN